MKEFKFKKIDAFATTKSNGNPAGYITVDSKDSISPDEMQQVAKELQGFVNEVGYIYKVDCSEFELKYYSAEKEVDFCGHATIAIMYDLIKSYEELMSSNLLTIKTNMGTLPVENRVVSEDAVFIMSPPPIEQKNTLTAKNLATALKINTEDIEPKLPVKIVNAGLTTLIIPIKSLDIIINISPDLDELKKFCTDLDVDIIEVFTKDVANKDNDYRVRVFAPRFGYLEDPATGSGNSALGYYLLQNQMWNKETIVIEQNGSLNRYNIVKLQKKRDDTGTDRVLFGGSAIKRVEGTYNLY